MKEEKSQLKHAKVTWGTIAAIPLISLGTDEHQGELM